MDTLLYWFNWVLHLNVHLYDLALSYGNWIYALLFLIVFCETGLVIMPFLPGDSLLFAAGSISAITPLSPHIITALLITAATMGDNLNYWIGRTAGKRLLGTRWLNQAHFDKTHAFYEKYGGTAIIIARFAPIIRTFMPFVAGVAAMTYRRFVFMSIVAAIIWVGSLTYISYFFGNLPFVKAHFSYIILGIIAVSMLPAVITVMKLYLGRRQEKVANR